MQALLILIGGGFFLYEKFWGASALHNLEQIQHELSATEKCVFSRDKMKFTEIQNNKAFLAHVNFVNGMPVRRLGYCSSDMGFAYDEIRKGLTITIKNLRLYPFPIDDMKSEKTSNGAWLNKGNQRLNPGKGSTIGQNSGLTGVQEGCSSACLRSSNSP